MGDQFRRFKGTTPFKNEEQAIMVKKALESKGYNPEYEILDGEVFFNLVLQLIPKVSEVKKIESLLNRVSVMHGVEYIGFGVGDEE